MNSWQNTSLSDSIDGTLKLQGVSYLMRTVIANLSITVEPNHYIDDAGVEHIDMKQIIAGIFNAPTDNLVLNKEDHRRGDNIFGPLVINARRIKVDELEIDFLKEDWTDDTLEDGVIYCTVRSDTEKTGKDWVVNVVSLIIRSGGRMPLTSCFQDWGFTIKDGVRRFARRYRFTTKDISEPIYVRLYYDYCGCFLSSLANPD